MVTNRYAKELARDKDAQEEVRLRDRKLQSKAAKLINIQKDLSRQIYEDQKRSEAAHFET